MARYKMREMPDLHGTGERKTYPHMVIERMIPLDELLERMSEETTFGAHELRAFAADPGSGIRATGRGSHRVYVRGTTGTDG